MKPLERRYKLGDSINWDAIQRYGRDHNLSINTFTTLQLIARTLDAANPSRFFTL